MNTRVLRCLVQQTVRRASTVTTGPIHDFIAVLFPPSLPSESVNVNFCYMPFRELALPFEELFSAKMLYDFPRSYCVARFFYKYGMDISSRI